MVWTKFFAISALIGAAHAAPVLKAKQDIDTSKPVAAVAVNAPESVELSTALTARLLTFVVSAIEEMAGACSSEIFEFSATSIVSATESVAGEEDGQEEEALKLTMDTSSGAITVTVLEKASGDLHLDWIEPYTFMPQCVIDEIDLLIISEKTATEPSNEDELEEFLEEESTGVHKSGRSASQMPKVKKLKKAKYAKKGTFRTFRKPTTPTTHSMGLKGTKEDALPYRVQKIKPADQAVYAKDLTDDWTPFTGAAETCYTEYTPRDQGSCGSCYAFAATTAHALQGCIVLANAGGSVSEFPMLTAQGMVSCGLEKGYTGGCDGGSGYNSMQYLVDFGSTIVGCWPYSSGGGDALNHFDEHGNEVATCRETTCVPESIEPEMKFSTGSGVYSFDDEANIAQALMDYGPMWCAFDVYSSFFNYDGGVYMGAEGDSDSVAGGHAVVVYGWGTTSDGIKYWKAMNCARTPPQPAG